MASKNAEPVNRLGISIAFLSAKKYAAKFGGLRGPAALPLDRLNRVSHPGSMKNDVAEMLLVSRDGLEEIKDEIHGRAEVAICHRFSGPEGVGWDSVQEKAYVAILVPALSAYGFDVEVIGGPAGVEAWERVRPSEAWSAKTIPNMCALGDKAGCIYEGWSWEPGGRPGYLQRLRPRIVMIALWLSLVFAIELTLSWVSGDIKGGSAGYIALRIFGTLAVIGIGSFVIAAALEWQRRGKNK